MKSVCHVACVVVCFFVMQGILPAATYSPGFAWGWADDYSVTDNTPGDSGSIANPANAGKSSGAATADVWGYMSLSALPAGGFPDGTEEPSVFLGTYQPYYVTYGHVWSNAVAGVGIDDGTDSNFDTANRGKKFIAPDIALDANRETMGIRFVAPVAGVYDVSASFTPAAVDACPGNGITCRISKNTASLTPLDEVAKKITKTYNMTGMGLGAGDRLYFCVGPNGTTAGSWECDETITEITVTYQGPPSTAVRDWSHYME